MIRQLLIGLAATLALAGCGGKSSETKAPAGPQIAGAGATFPAPLYAKWAETQRAETGVTLNYQAIGSGGGVKQIKAKTVAFGATDKPLKAEELAEAGLVQFPTVIGGVVVVMNLPGIESGQIKLTAPVVADIFMGKIKSWTAPEIAALNPGVKLPNLPITVVHRSDGSGTTFLFTSYLTQAAPAWAAAVGANDAIAWPTGQGGKGNDGVAAFVKQTPGAVGYVEFAYAKQNKMPEAQLQTASGEFVAPTAEAFAAAAAGADWSKAPGFNLLMLNQPGAGAWPITGATFILLYKEQADPNTAKAVLGFFDRAYTGGDASASELAYVPLPSEVKALVRASWSAVVGPDGEPVYTPAP